jgi:3-dehydroquinate synthase
VTTDLVGFVAATFCRGIPVVYCPTSLLAMVDASIGGKTGLNTPYGKNLIGSFYQPKAVFIDPLVLKTLPKELFSEGMAEAIKHALLTSQVMVDDLLNNSQAIMTLEPTVLIKMISENLKVKKHYVELDEKETAGPRKLLNLGHTVAHGIEKLSQHQVNHGQAVGLGLIAEAKMAQAMDIANQNVVDTIIKLLNAFNLPTKLQENFDQEELIAALMHDKKNSNGEIHCCFLETIGQPYIKNGRFSHAVNPELIKL